MSGIAVFVPNEEMYDQAEKILQGKKNHVKCLKLVETEEAVYQARQVILEEGINIIVARGKQAADIRRYTNVAVAEIQMTAQEMALLVNKAKKAVGKEKPGITVFYWENMLCDTSYFDTLYGIRLERHQFQEEENWRSIFLKACEKKPDMIIGGKSVREAADQQGIPSLPFLSTGECLRMAIGNAESLYVMAEAEQRNYAQFTTILDSSFNGIMKVTNNGTILVMNRVMEQITGLAEKEAVGLSVTKLFKDLDHETVLKAIHGGMGNYTTFINEKDDALVMVIEPILVDGKPDGAILSCNRLKRLDIKQENRLNEQYLRGYAAYGTFDELEKRFLGLQNVIQLSKLYAQSSSPVLIEGYAGPEQDSICQGIHNYSLRKNGPFIVVNLAGMSENQQLQVLFGTEGQKEKGALEQADRGTLVIQSIDKMTLPVQYHFSRVFRSRRLLYNSIEKVKIVDIRIIACTSKDIDTCRRLNRMRSDLYYAINALKIRIPPLKDRPQDMEYLLDLYVKRYMDQYYRYHTLTAGARRTLLEYPWPGNSIQLQAFCERMILTVRRRMITAEYVTSLLEELYGHTQEPDYYTKHGLTPPEAGEQVEERELEEYTDFKAAIVEALTRAHGNRTIAAKQLGISTTTLWRKMKTYNIK